jgi:uncharacterized protein
VRFDALEIDDHILDKIESRHGVTLEEAEEVCLGAPHVRRGREGLYEVYGQTGAGRYLLVVLADVGSRVGRVVTAREMTVAERRLYGRR